MASAAQVNSPTQAEQRQSAQGWRRWAVALSLPIVRGARACAATLRVGLIGSTVAGKAMAGSGWVGMLLIGLSFTGVDFADLGGVAAAADWPTYAHDQSRTGKTSEQLAFPLAESWSWKSDVRPSPVWDEPATWDGWNKVYDLRNRVDFDKAFQTVVVGDRLWYASSVEDKLFCVDLATGQSIWSFYAEAPIRLAPTVTQGRVYFGADDGRVYCLDAAEGKLLWKKRLAPHDLRVAGNGRLISLWPVRTSVVVVDDSCYACAGVFPSETVYLCGLDAENGESQWQTPIEDLPAQGYLLASPKRLYVTAGRGGPLVFNRADGRRLAQVDTTGGTYALLADDTLITTTGKDGRELQALATKNRDRLATFRGHKMIVEGSTFYLQDRSHLTAIDRDAYYTLTSERRDLDRQRQQLKQRRKALEKDSSSDSSDPSASEISAAELKSVELKKIEAEQQALNRRSDELLEAIENCYLWRVACHSPQSLILSGATLIAGGSDRVTAYDVANGQVVWQDQVDGNAYGLAVANRHLVVSTDAGAVHVFAAQHDAAEQSAVEVPNEQPPLRPIADSPSETALAAVLPADRPAGPEARIKPISAEGPGQTLGPFVNFVAPSTIRVTWKTDRPTTTRIEMAKLVQGERTGLIRPGQPADRQQDHQIEIPQIQRGAMYTFRVGGLDQQGQPAWTSWYRFDAMLHYLKFAPAEVKNPFPNTARTERLRAAAKSMLAAARTRAGYALVLGASDGCLAYELAVQSDLKIVVIEERAEQVQQIRADLHRAGLYGHRVAVLEGSLASIPLAPYVANLITSQRALEEGDLPESFAEVYHSLQPAGGLLWLAGPTRAVSNAQSGGLDAAQVNEWMGDVAVGEDQSEWQTGDRGLQGETPIWIHRRARLPGAADWSHQYASPDNASCSRDTAIRGDMSVLWWGRPGARPMPDRGGRNPSPVSANGRLFVQGDRTLFGMDAYNGTILWCHQVPEMRRTNLPRDSSNMVATDDLLYLALGDRAVGFEAGSGQRISDFRVAPLGSEVTLSAAYNWGYLAAIGERLLGSSVRRGAQYLGDDGEWFEEFETSATARVTSQNLFALDRHSGELLWNYAKGIIINSTITSSERLVWFVESRSDEAKQAESSRLFAEVLQHQYLVALDLETGEIRWEKPIDLSQCQYMTYLCYSEGKLVMTGTDEGQEFHTYVYYAADGVPLWEHHAQAKKVHHSGKLDHPTVVNNRLYLNKHVYDLSTGTVLEVDEFDWHGCGVMSASGHSLFRRFEFHGMYDLHTKKRTEFLGLRSGCWLSLIPSGGLLLAPETSAGCSCDHSIQTSIAYVPELVRSRRSNSP